MPVGTDLVLHEKPDAETIRLDGARLGAVVMEAARRYGTPLAFPLMDLTVEKGAIFAALGFDHESSGQAHLEPSFDDDAAARVVATLDTPTPRMVAIAEAIRTVAETDDLVPVGMSIGPFSLMTKLLADPITPVYTMGMGITAEEDEEVAMVERALTLAEEVIMRSLRRQAEAGARAVFVCEPAANVAFLSPKQLEAGSDVFERTVMEPNRRLKAELDRLGVQLIFHDCGELTDAMVRDLASLRPAVLSLGSSRELWHDAALVPKDVVLYGNLPSKRFYSDDLTTVASVQEDAKTLLARMAETGHPFILGSECDVLSVTGCEATIRAKVAGFLQV